MLRSKPILVIQALLAGAIVFFGAVGLSDRIDEDIVYFANLAIGAITAMLGVYLSGTNTPTAQVVATQEKAGAPVIAGPQSSVTTGEVLSHSDAIHDIAPQVPTSPVV